MSKWYQAASLILGALWMVSSVLMGIDNGHVVTSMFVCTSMICGCIGSKK